MRKHHLIVFLIAALLVSAGCTNSSKPLPPSNQLSHKSKQQAARTFTLAELAQYNGQNGKPAYAAVDGVIYDITNESMWVKGLHFGHKAGTDLTSVMKDSPHGKSVLSRYPVVGKLKK
ncbi:MAG: cytochrome b5 domain-containing protein [Candidatus Saccharibacteria bacterium]